MGYFTKALKLKGYLRVANNSNYELRPEEDRNKEEKEYKEKFNQIDGSQCMEGKNAQLHYFVKKDRYLQVMEMKHFQKKLAIDILNLVYGGKRSGGIGDAK